MPPLHFHTISMEWIYDGGRGWGIDLQHQQARCSISMLYITLGICDLLIIRFLLLIQVLAEFFQGHPIDANWNATGNITYKGQWEIQAFVGMLLGVGEQLNDVAALGANAFRMRWSAFQRIRRIRVERSRKFWRHGVHFGAG